MRWVFCLTLLAIIVAFPAEAGAPKPEVTLLNFDGMTRKTFAPFPAKHIGGMSVVAGDLGHDGVAEIVVGSGSGREPEVKIFRQDGSLVTSFLAYQKTFDRGLSVALGDIDGDGLAEIVTSPGYGGGPHIKIFDGRGNLKGEFFAYAANFRGGVFIAVRDLDGDGRAEIVTGAGPTGGPHVRIFDHRGELRHEFFAFNATDASGVTVGAADLAGDGKGRVLVGRASSDPPEVKIFTPDGRELGKLMVYEPTFAGGVTPLGADTNGDGRDEIVVTPNGGGAPIKIFRPNGTLERTLTPFENFSGAVRLAVTSLSSTGERVLITAPSPALRDGPIESPKSIVVDLSEQRLYALEHGLVRASFLVSSGVKKFPTPEGEFKIQAKKPFVDYVWTYGPNHPENYSYPKIPWNLQFKPHYYIHYASWHNNFGRPRSHGCVNMALEPAKWMYNWADVGVPVTIRD